MDYLLGVDVGTTATKSVLFTTEGSLVDFASKEYGLIYPHEGWVEQEADDWWKALTVTVREIVERNRCGKNVVGMSLSAQGGALVLLDVKFKPIVNAISWLDSRAKETAHLFTRYISAEQLYRTCGWPITNGLNFPTIFWFKEKHPEIYDKTKYFASTIDYINYLLTRKFAIDPTNLALTMFLDLEKNDISDKALQIAGITRANVPEVVPSGKVIGNLTSEAAGLLGLSEKVIVVSGAHDQYCANIGAGAVNIGDCVLSAGTAWVLLATCDKLYFNEKSLVRESITSAVFPGPHPIEGRYGLMTSVPFGGNSLTWFKDVMRPDSHHEMIDRDAARTPIGSEGLLFIPISSTKSGKGAFLGIDGIHNIKHFTRAILEGVAFVNRKHLDMIQESGVEVKNLIMIGGGAKSTIWPQIVADVCGVQVSLPDLSEAACTGAAILAGTGCGVFRFIEEGSRKITRKKKQVLPDKKNVEIYEKLYHDFLGYLNSL